MYIERFDFENFLYFGVYGCVIDRVFFLREGLGEKKLEVLREVFKVLIIEISIMKLRIVGIFVVGNFNVIIVFWYIWDVEFERIKIVFNEFGIDMDVVFFKSRFIVFGNFILINDKVVFVSKEFMREEVNVIGEILGVDEVERGMIVSYCLVGSVGVVMNKGGFVYFEVIDEEFEWLSDFFGVDIYVGIVNMGVLFVGFCMLVNLYGVVVGYLMIGFEIVKIEEVFGFFG